MSNWATAVGFVTANCFRNAQAVCDWFPHPFFSCSLQSACRMLSSRPSVDVALHCRLLGPCLETYICPLGGHAWILAWDSEVCQWIIVDSYQSARRLGCRAMDNSSLLRICAALGSMDQAARQGSKQGWTTALGQLMSAVAVEHIAVTEHHVFNMWVARARSSWTWRILSLFLRERNKHVTC